MSGVLKSCFLWPNAILYLRKIHLHIELLIFCNLYGKTKTWLTVVSNVELTIWFWVKLKFTITGWPQMSLENDFKIMLNITWLSSLLPWAHQTNCLLTLQNFTRVSLLSPKVASFFLWASYWVLKFGILKNTFSEKPGFSSRNSCTSCWENKIISTWLHALISSLFKHRHTLTIFSYFLLQRIFFI